MMRECKGARGRQPIAFLTLPLQGCWSLRVQSWREVTLADEVGVAGNRVRSFVERIKQLEGEIAELNEGKKEVFAEAKGEGFDVKILKEIVKLRKQDQDERDEHETLLDVYMRAMETAEPETLAKAA